MIYATDEARADELERALDGYTIQLSRSTNTLIAALANDPPPRPQVLVIDLDPLTPIELFELHRLRECGWFGSIIALGDVPKSLRQSLGIETVLPRPEPAPLHDAIARIQFDAKTTRLPVMRTD